MIQKGFNTRNSVLTKLFLSDDRFNVHKFPSIFWFYHPSAVSATDIRKAVLLTASVIVAITTASHLWGWLPGSRTRSLVLQILVIFRIASRPTQLQKRTFISSLNSEFHILYLTEILYCKGVSQMQFLAFQLTSPFKPLPQAEHKAPYTDFKILGGKKIKKNISKFN